MAFTLPAVAEPQRLTDVQLVHRVHAALAARHAITDASPAHLLAPGLRHPFWYCLTYLALESLLMSKGAWLALTFASPARLAGWAEASDARLTRHMADLVVLFLLDETERRVRARRRSVDAREPWLQRGC